MSKVIVLKTHNASKKASLSENRQISLDEAETHFVVKGTASTNRQYGRAHVESYFIIEANSRKQATDIYNELANKRGWLRVIDGDARLLVSLDTMKNFKE